MRFSVVIPVYNRPEELQELLATICRQSRLPDEVVVIEDGSTLASDKVVAGYSDRLNIIYHVQENTGQGFARNTGYRLSTGDFLIVFDSDCLLPDGYLEGVEAFLKTHAVDAFGGPDAAHPSFNKVQKAISHSMTSFFTTGGMRGGKIRIGGYHPRSFNMGISREAFEKTGGYRIPFMGEDLEFSTRLIDEGLVTALIPQAVVYHKRRTSLIKFFKQLFYFGRARINLTRFHPGQLKLMHWFPTIFTAGLAGSLILLPIAPVFGATGIGLYLFYFGLVALECSFKYRSLAVGALSAVAVWLQFAGYGTGLVYELVRKWRGIDPNTPYIDLY